MDVLKDWTFGVDWRTTEECKKLLKSGERTLRACSSAQEAKLP